MSGRRDLKLDLSTNELVFSRGALVWLEDGEAVKQSLAVRLRFFLGEWFLNADIGADWHSVLGVKGAAGRAENVARKTILGTPGVVDISSMTVDFVGSTRQLSINWAVTTDFGQLSATTQVG